MPFLIKPIKKETTMPSPMPPKSSEALPPEHLANAQRDEPIVLLPMQIKPITIGIVAGEASGDALGANFMRQMNNLRDDIVWVGVGGSQMQAQGLTSLFEMSRLSVMGLVEVVGHLPDLFKARDEILTAFDKQKIDIFVGIDAPDFNLRLGKILKPKNVFCVQYVSPSIWAWREKRIEKIKQATHLVLCLFPFELPVYTKHNHPAVCVGHSLLHTIDTRLLNKDMTDQRFALIWENVTLRAFFAKTNRHISHLIAVMPGSRRGEINAILPKMLSAIQRLLVVDEELCFIIPTISQNHQAIVAQYLEAQSPKLQSRVVVCCDEGTADFSQQVMASADMVLLASGTATLEAMLLARPMVVIYQLKPLTYWFAKRMVKIPYVALPNILASQFEQKPVVPELIQESASPDNICRAVQQTLTPNGYAAQQKGLMAIAKKLREQSNTMPANVVIDHWVDWQKTRS